MSEFCVLTTINPPTASVEVLHSIFGSNLIVVGDKKTPQDWAFKSAQYINPDSKVVNHYARKNIGYMEAMRQGADLIYDTDDDNTPLPRWKMRHYSHHAHPAQQAGWYNVYKAFMNQRIWPRGFSLRELHDEPNFAIRTQYLSSIQQGLADGEADVDAIYRLTNPQPTTFAKRLSINVGMGQWCPFNSQSTWWFPKAYVLMYLPVYATFRMTDIWRSFIAQRCLWEINEGVTFHSPSEVIQHRNPHDLLKDFEDEIPGYLHNDKIVKLLEGLKLQPGEQAMADNLLTCYYALTNAGYLPNEEIESVKEWIDEFKIIQNDTTRTLRQA